ncbi:uncharacterized protein LOC104582707 isoform X3 [Brachypodium distachyon]|uniref:uncharacterized protein LOC104582707 isoform X3 n=1 Tax=Brachypodium distachyon TaxID=15368 RepID=UPI000D0D48CC|nr:uncharacterized protein LOC104582707 isoform X3 [Brachypodium distachyon]|eukprot:XP_024314421.1 uncharacterized protein LOC104582707 isoform X3 [Brachypodium distachyon]
MAEAVRRWGQDYSYTVFGCKNWRLELPIRNLKSRIPAFGCSWHSRAAFQTNSESPPARLHLLSCDTKGFHSVLVGIGSRVPVRTEQETERAREERRGGEEHGATRPGGGDDAEFPEELVPREAYWSMAEANGKKGSRGYLTWTPDMDTALLAVLVERHNNGDHAQNGWKPHVYNACIRHVKDTCGVDITKDNMTARCKTFDKHYEVISKILAQSGFGWDWENNKLSIDSEDVWSKYVEANKAAGSYKTKVVMNWDQISTIYSKDHATGEGAKTAAECVQE